jgi:LmbE family N-acetylglucosaminyl deacetylase
MAAAITPIVEQFKPDAVFVPWFLDGHSDHRAMSQAVARLEPSPEVEVWAFEWWSALPANRVVDITSVYAKKEACVAAHETAHLAFDVGAALALSRWRSLHGLHGKGYAEAFLTAPHAEYRQLVERVSAVPVR